MSFLNKIFLIALAGFILLSVSTHLVSAQGIVGVSPGSYGFKEVLRGGYAERSFTVTLSKDEPVKVSLEPLGEIKNWIGLEVGIAWFVTLK